MWLALDQLDPTMPLSVKSTSWHPNGDVPTHMTTSPRDVIYFSYLQTDYASSARPCERNRAQAATGQPMVRCEQVCAEASRLSHFALEISKLIERKERSLNGYQARERVWRGA